MIFPNVEGENLDGQLFTFPRDFSARTIAIVAFDFKQRGELESWVPFVDRYARAGTVHGRVFPVISRSMRTMKSVILTTMRKTVPTPEARAATVPLFLDIDEFCGTLGIGDRRAIHVYVLEPSGAVVEHQAGAFTDSAAAALEVHVKKTA